MPWIEKNKGNLDDFVKISIYGVLCRDDSQHTTCIVVIRPGTLLLGVYAYLTLNENSNFSRFPKGCFWQIGKGGTSTLLRRILLVFFGIIIVA